MMFHMAAVHDSEDVPDQVKARTLRIPCQHCGRGFRGEINLQRHIQCVHSKVCHLYYHIILLEIIIEANHVLHCLSFAYPVKVKVYYHFGISASLAPPS